MEKPRITVFCINLTRRPDRWARMSDLARTHGFALHRVQAVDAKDLDNADAIGALIQSGPIGKLGTGTLACTLSHTLAWKALVASGLERAVILEDDMILSDDFTSVIDALGSCPDLAELVKLDEGGPVTGGVLLSRTFRNICGRDLRDCFQMAVGGGAYLISRNAAQIALSRIGQCDVSVDHFLFYPIRRRGALGAAFQFLDPPVAVYEFELGSDIAPRRFSSNQWQRRLRRTFYEIAPGPYMLWKLASWRGFVKKCTFRKQSAQQRP